MDYRKLHLTSNLYFDLKSTVYDRLFWTITDVTYSRYRLPESILVNSIGDALTWVHAHGAWIRTMFSPVNLSVCARCSGRWRDSRTCTLLKVQSGWAGRGPDCALKVAMGRECLFFRRIREKHTKPVHDPKSGAKKTPI